MGTYRIKETRKANGHTIIGDARTYQDAKRTIDYLEQYTTAKFPLRTCVRHSPAKLELDNVIFEMVSQSSL